MTRSPITRFDSQLKAGALVAAVACFAQMALANPVGPTVVNGAATFATTGNTFAITNTPGAIINWQQFNISQNEITKFIQQSQQSTVLNRITGQDPSQIFGALQSNGKVLLVNPNGVVFGPNAAVDVFGLVVSNLNLANADFLAGRYRFNGDGNGSIINQGAITTPVGGSVYLVGNNVSNNGIITSPKGEVLLAAGNTVTLADTGTPAMTVTLNASGNKAVNLGQINAAGGNIDIYGALIDQQGLVRADSASMDAQGRVTLKASDSVSVAGSISATNTQGAGGRVSILGDKVNLAGSANVDVSGARGGGTVLAGGDYQGKNSAVQNATETTVASGATIKADALQKGNGGKVVVWANDTATFAGGITARGGALQGNGGNVEVSGKRFLDFKGVVNTMAPNGQGGSLLLDPNALCITIISGPACPRTGLDPNNLLATVYAHSNLSPTQLEEMVASNGSTTLATNDYGGGGFLSFEDPVVFSAGQLTGGRSLTLQADNGTLYFGGHNTIDARSGGGPLNLAMNATGSDGGVQLSGIIYTNGGTFSSTAPAVAFVPQNQGTVLFTNGGNITIDASINFRFAMGTTNTPGSSWTTGTIDAGAGSITISSPSVTFDAGSTLTGSSLVVNGQSVTPGTFSTTWRPSTTTTTTTSTTTTTAPTTTTTSTTTSSSTTTTTAPTTTTTTSTSTTTAPTTTTTSTTTSSSTTTTTAPTTTTTAPTTTTTASTTTTTQAPTTTTSSTTTTPTTTTTVAATTTTTLAPISFAGNYSGTYSGNEKGTWDFTIAPNGAITGKAANVDGSVTTLTGSATTTGNLTASGSGSDGQVFSGTYNATTGVLSGIWSWPAANQSGQFTGSKQGSTTVSQAVSRAVSDTCATNALLCTTTSTVTVSAQRAIDLTASTAKATVSYDEKLKVVDAKTTDTKAADTKAADSKATTTESSTKSAAASDDKSTAGTRSSAAAPVVQSGKAVLASAQAVDARKSPVELKTEARQAATEAKQITVEAKQAAVEAKQAVGAVKLAAGEAKKAETQAKTADASARKADAEAKQAEVEVKAAKTPEQKAQAETRKIQAEAKRSEAEAKRADAEAKKPEVEAKQATAEAKQANAEAKQSHAASKQAESEAKLAAAEVKESKTPEQKVAAERRADDKRVESIQRKAEADVKLSKAEAKQAEAGAHQAKAEAKKSEAVARQSEAEAKHAEVDKTPVRRVEVEVKKAESDVKKADADVRKIQGELKKVAAEVKAAKSPEQKLAAESKQKAVETRKTEAEAKLAERKTEAETKKGELAKASDRKALVEAKKAESESKQKVAEAKKAEAETKVAAQERRQEARRAEAVKAFGRTVVSVMSYEQLAAIAAVRHEIKTEILRPALTILEQNPKAADLPTCGVGSDVCVPAKPAVTEAAGKAAAQAPPVALPKPTLSFVPQIERKVAVIVGINNYADKTIPPLESAVPDAEALGKMLQDKLGYEVKLVRDASRADIVKSLNAVAQEVGPNDSVAVYYAGHGYMLEQGTQKTGYWIPSDAKSSSPQQWISNSDIAKLLGNIPAKQVMLVSDSCYSGALVGSNKVSADVAAKQPHEILQQRSVALMSSGGEEPVSDEGKEGHSIFAWTLMNSLKKVDNYQTGVKLFDNVRQGVLEDFPQVPQYGASTAAGHSVGGDYLIEVRSYK